MLRYYEGIMHIIPEYHHKSLKTLEMFDCFLKS